MSVCLGKMHNNKYENKKKGHSFINWSRNGEKWGERITEIWAIEANKSVDYKLVWAIFSVLPLSISFSLSHLLPSRKRFALYAFSHYTTFGLDKEIAQYENWNLLHLSFEICTLHKNTYTETHCIFYWCHNAANCIVLFSLNDMDFVLNFQQLNTHKNRNSSSYAMKQLYNKSNSQHIVFFFWLRR